MPVMMIDEHGNLSEAEGAEKMEALVEAGVNICKKLIAQMAEEMSDGGDRIGVVMLISTMLFSETLSAALADPAFAAALLGLIDGSDGDKDNVLALIEKLRAKAGEQS